MTDTAKQAAQLLEPLPVPAYLFELSTEKFLGSNQAMRDLVGYTEEELLALDWRDLLAPEQVGTAQRAIESGAIMRAVEWKWRRKDGSALTVTLASRATMFVDDDGIMRHVVMALVIGSEKESVISADIAFR